MRAKLGLAPLRTSATTNVATSDTQTQQPQPSGGGGGGDEKVLELSIHDSNALRAKLGLPPLRESSTERESKIQHAPAINLGQQQQVQQGIEKATLQRQVQKGVSKFAVPSLGESTTDAKSWAQQMRNKEQPTKDSTEPTTTKKSKQKKANKRDKKVSKTNKTGNDYTEDDLRGLRVGHSVAELADGSTTVLTLADSSILQVDQDSHNKVLGLDEDGPQLENVQLSEQQKVQDGLRKKRQLELGSGRAGGYAGYDDDEFVELGGTQGPSQQGRSLLSKNDTQKQKRKAGFEIGAVLEEQAEEEESDLFAVGKAISLQPTQADVVASDFLSVEEDQAMRTKTKKKKEKFKKKKKDKKKQKKHGRKIQEESDEEEEDGVIEPISNKMAKGGLLDELEATAVDTKPLQRKRRRSEDDEEDLSPDVAATKDLTKDRRAKFDAIMAKGNQRTQNAFGDTKKKPSVADLDEEEPDDAFLNAALAKARRLNKLKELSDRQKSSKGEEAVLEAVKSSQTTTANAAPDSVTSNGTGRITFSVDETSEFTRALRAREEQVGRKQPKKAKTSDDGAPSGGDGRKETITTVKEEPDSDQEMPDISELAKEVKEEEGGLDGTTGNDAPIGKGLAGVLGLLRQTGELTRKNAGKEEMRGRAKDERTYEDYEALDLKSVVKIDEKRATSKDKEFARREIKLEYRDKHGRLLTRKEAFRDLSYQFHGHGSGKRKEEKRNEQIAREQAEARLASRQGSEGGVGTLGALKATQKATGKAFIVHKT